MTCDVIKEAYAIVNDMEYDLEDARVFADGVSILAAEALHDDQKLGAVLMRLGWQDDPVVATLLALAVEFEARAVAMTAEEASEKQVEQIPPKSE